MKKEMKKEDKLFTPGNIILGIIIIVLIGSLFFDFFGGSKGDEPIGCPIPIKNLIITNAVYATNGKSMFQDRILKYEDKSTDKYTISALLRNIGDEEIIISRLGLTNYNFGPLDLVDVKNIILKGNSMESVEFTIPSGTYHKIDFYTEDPCQGVIIWHENGEGSKFLWELEAENATISEETDVLV